MLSYFVKVLKLLIHLNTVIYKNERLNMVPNHNYTETYLYWIKIDKNAFNNLTENFEFLKELKENCI